VEKLICGEQREKQKKSRKAEVPRMLARGNAGCTNQLCINRRVVVVTIHSIQVGYMISK
jgi:hypothetical protein